MQKQKKPKRPTLLAGGGADDLYLRPGASGVSLAAAARGNSGRKRATLTGGSSGNLAGMG